MSDSTADVRIRKTRPLLSPAILEDELPLSEENAVKIANHRRAIADCVHGRDSRLMVVVGPCSIHDPDAALEYAERLQPVAQRVSDAILVVLRVYFEKPRTVVGWKGLINDPDLDGSFQINRGLRLARRLLLDIAGLGLPAANEFLDTTLGQYYADLVSWGAIGARTVESQIHRELASGLSMPVGFKNRTDGNTRVAVDAMRAARCSHWFPSLTHEGSPAIFETAGNPDTHLVLRGGDQSGPNHDAESVSKACEALTSAELAPRVMVDCSHANSGKIPENQIGIAESIAKRVSEGDKRVFALMLESHLLGGRQDLQDGKAGTYGQSITDACLGFEETETLLESLSSRLMTQ
ncbi:MAG: 3-deoxy-7-phosphoheptulonate synthase [Planctomycetota bacterium]